MGDDGSVDQVGMLDESLEVSDSDNDMQVFLHVEVIKLVSCYGNGSLQRFFQNMVPVERLFSETPEVDNRVRVLGGGLVQVDVQKLGSGAEVIKQQSQTPRGGFPHVGGSILVELGTSWGQGLKRQPVSGRYAVPLDHLGNEAAVRPHGVLDAHVAAIDGRFRGQCRLQPLDRPFGKNGQQRLVKTC